MNQFIEFNASDGLYRLEAVLPGVIRVAHTKETAVAPPSMLLQTPEMPGDPGDFAGGGQDDCRIRLRSGDLWAEYDRASGRLTWRDGQGGTAKSC